MIGGVRFLARAQSLVTERDQEVVARTEAARPLLRGDIQKRFLQVAFVKDGPAIAAGRPRKPTTSARRTAPRISRPS